MKKIPPPFVFIGIYLLIGILTAAYADPIDHPHSVQVARRWLEISKNPMGHSIGKIGKTQTYLNAKGEARFHVVNLEPSGFIVLAADDNLEPVIAFSHEGIFNGVAGNPLFDLLSKDTEELTRHLQSNTSAKHSSYHLQSKAKWNQLSGSLASVNGVTSSSGAATSASAVSDICVAPMLQSKWDQSTIYSGTTRLAVYNYYTPPYAPANINNYVCGCVATTWAQIMRFYQWPTTSVGTQSFSITSNGSPSSLALRGGDGHGGPYVWANMVLVPGTGITTQQCQAIGSLTFDAGVANSMDYEQAGSGAYLSSSIARTVFHYANAINSPGDLPSILLAVRTNLDAGMPVALAISSPSLGGHEVVCDGYGYNLSTLYHHINMGWGGVSDLWYNLPTIAGFTSVTGCTYNIDPTVQGEIISGRITNLSGTPLSGVTVNLTGATSHSTTTNSNGIYFFKGLGSNSTWTIVPQEGVTVFGPSQKIMTIGASTDYSTVGDKIADFQAGNTSQTGYLQMNIAPLNASSAGAQWQVDDGAWHNNGDLVSGLLSGSHSVAFKTISGWSAPVKMTVLVNISQLTTGVGTYQNNTPPAGSFPPSVITGTSNSVTLTSGTLTGTVNPKGVSTTAQFEYGLTNAYGATAIVTVSPSAGASVQNVSAGISGLQSGMIYHYRLDATNANGVAMGNDATFSTEGVPVVTTGVASNITFNSATVAGTVNPNGLTTTALVQYGLTTLYGGTATILLSPNNGITAQSVSAALSSLQPGATYHYCLAATNSKGTATSSDATFTLPVIVSTIAGSPGLTGTTDGIGSAARFNNPYGIAVDGSGNCYVTDLKNYTVRKMTPSGNVTTFAGGIHGVGNGTGTGIQFWNPAGIAIDGSSNIYVADYASIRKITPSGVSNTLAGDLYTTGSADGASTNARFNFPNGLAVDGSNNVYVADTYNHTIRKITPTGVVSTLAGSPGVSGTTDATGSNAQFYYPSGVAVDGNGNVYVADTFNNTIRKISSSGAVSTFAGTPSALGTYLDGTGSDARFSFPPGITMGGGGNLYVADQSNHIIRKITSTGVVTTFAGIPNSSGSTDGLGSVAQFNNPTGVTVDGSGNVYGVDQNNHTIRKISQYFSNLPAVTLLGQNPLTFEAGGTYTDPGATAVDAKGNPLTPVFTASTVVPNLPGAYSIKWIATDSLAVTGTALRIVNIVDTTPPSITTPASLTVNATSVLGANVIFTTSAVDLISGPVSTLNTPLSGSFFPLGATTVISTASDTAGNMAFKPFIVTVMIPPLTASESIAPRLALSSSTVNITVKSSVPTRNYQLQYSTDLSVGNWQNIGAIQIGTGSDLILSTPLNLSFPRCFYRLKLN